MVFFPVYKMCSIASRLLANRDCFVVTITTDAQPRVTVDFDHLFAVYPSCCVTYILWQNTSLPDSK